MLSLLDMDERNGTREQSMLEKRPYIINAPRSQSTPDKDDSSILKWENLAKHIIALAIFGL